MQHELLERDPACNAACTHNVNTMQHFKQDKALITAQAESYRWQLQPSVFGLSLMGTWF